MTPVPVLRQAPMRWQRSAAPRMPPCSANDSRVSIGPAGGSAGSRRSAVIATGSTITPGLRRLCGSNSSFVRCIASYRSSPKMRSLKRLRTRPSPCSDEFTPPNSATSSMTSVATASIVAIPPGSVRSTNGRMWRQPTDAWPYQPAVRPWRVEDRLEARDVVVEPLGRHRGVLDERERPARALAGRHQQAEAGLADVGERGLLGRRLGHDRVVRVPLEAVELRPCLVLGVARRP